MSWIKLRGPQTSAARSNFPLVTSADFCTMVLVAVGELQQIAIERRAKVEEFQRKHRVGLLTLIFTDIVDSTKLKQTFGDREAVTVIQRHHAEIREILGHFSEGEEIETAGDSFFIVFTKPSDAVKFSLVVQARLRALSTEVGRLVFDRIGIHVGEVWIEENEGTDKARDLYGLQVDTCARVQSLGQADQILLSRFPFDSARQALKGEELPGIEALSWLDHGPYRMKGVEEPLEICEVGEIGKARLMRPPDSEKAYRFMSADSEPVLGWRPAIDQVVPGTGWVLEKKLGEGGFGEVWLGRDKRLKTERVFKFCFRADRVRSLKREATLFGLLKERVGEHPNIVAIESVYFDEPPPYYILMQHVAEQDLTSWCESQGGIEKASLETQLEIVAQIADALQAAHDSGVIHRDVKPSNILVSDQSENPIHAYLTDFGIGQIISDEIRSQLSVSGFSQASLESASLSGTQLYMAPELFWGKPASIRSDIYALGVVLYQLLVGDFRRPVTTDWAKQIKDPLLREDLEKCFAGDPQDRFAGAAQLAEQLRCLQERRETFEKQQAILKEREHAAYRRGILRTAALALVVIGLVTGLAIFGFWQKSEAEKQTGLAIKSGALADFDISSLFLDRSEPDWSQALAHLARGLRADPDNALLRQSSVLVLITNQWCFPCAEPLQEDGQVKIATFSPDGTRIVTASGNNAHIRNALTGKPVGQVLQHDGVILAASFSPDGTRILTSSRDCGARLWDAQSGRPIRFNGKEIVLQHDDAVSEAGFSPDGTRIVTASNDHTARFWDAQTGESIGQPLQHDEAVTAASFNPDGTRIVTVSNGPTARLWDVQTGKLVGQPLHHHGVVLAASFSADGTRILTSSRDCTARLWDAQSGRPILFNGKPILLQHGEQVRAASFSPDGKRIVTASDDYTARIWDARSGEPIGQPLQHNNTVWAASFSPDGTRIVTAATDHTARLWDAQTGKPVSQALYHLSWLTTASFSPDGTRIVTASNDHTARLWDAQRGEFVAQTLQHENEVLTGSFSSDGTRIVTVSGFAARLWDAQTGKPIGQPLQHAKDVLAARFSSDGTRIVTASNDHSARIWDVQTGDPIGQPLLHQGTVWAASFSPHGNRIVTASNDHSARIWDVQTGDPIGQPLLHQDTVWAASFSPDGNRIVTASNDHSARIWDAESGNPIGQPLLHQDIVWAASFSPDGAQILTASQDHTARLWDAHSGKLLRSLSQHYAGIKTAVFSPDGSRIVTASDDHTARLWDAQTGKPIGQPLQHDKEVLGASFSPDGALIITASADKTARLWDAKTVKAIGQPFRHDKEVLAASFSPAGDRIMTTSNDQSARIWDIGVDLKAAEPKWLPALLEALGGKRLNETGSLVDTEEDLFRMRVRLLTLKDDSFWSRLGRWLVVTGPERTISPISAVTVKEWEDQRRTARH